MFIINGLGGRLFERVIRGDKLKVYRLLSKRICSILDKSDGNTLSEVS